MSGQASSLSGRTVVVAGDATGLTAIADALVEAGAFVAVVSPHNATADVHAWFRADPDDPDIWDRVAPHVEQRLGPVDAVVTTRALHVALARVFEPDMRRRGHGTVIDADGRTTDEVLRLLGDRH